MGCGQSKINLYPRRNKQSKGQNGKKSVGGESKESEDDEAGGAGAGAAAEAVPAAAGAPGAAGGAGKPKPPIVPHALGHAAPEISASQQDFFKMLDEKIDKGHDYDSSSETEIQLEQARVTSLLTQWESASQSQDSSPSCQRGSPTSALRRRQAGQTKQAARSPEVRRCLKGQPASPPTKRQQPQQVLPYQTSEEQSPNELDSPVKRGQTLPQSNWKASPKIAAQFAGNKAVGKLQDGSEDVRCYSPSLLSQREIHQSYGISQEYIDSAATSRETSQITYNPTFQSHSPAHSAKMNNQAMNPQPYIAQIITYPMSQQAVAFQNAQKYISQQATPATYQQTPPVVQPIQTAQANQPIQPGPSGIQRYPGRAQVGSPQTQPNIYYIAPTAIVSPSQSQPESALTPKQQTALHLQQYVAMKQAQQAMGYQRIPGGQTVHDFGQYSPAPGDSIANYNRKLYDRHDESYSLNFMTVGRSPANQKAVLQTQTMRNVSPSLVQMQPPNMTQIPSNLAQYNQLLQRNQGLQNVFQNRPGCTASLGRNASLLSQKDMMAAERYGISSPTASSPISTQSNVSALRSNMCQSLNISTQKTVGQIVPIGGQDLIIYQNIADSAAAAAEARNARIQEAALNLETNGSAKSGQEGFYPTGDQNEQKIPARQHLGSNIVGRQIYYSQVVSAGDLRAGNSHFVGGASASVDNSAKKVTDTATLGRIGRNVKQTSMENTTNEFL